MPPFALCSRVIIRFYFQNAEYYLVYGLSITLQGSIVTTPNSRPPPVSDRINSTLNGFN